MLIRNYGLFWRLDKVHWGRQKNSGTLLGYSARKKRAPAVNFRYQRGVYVLYDDNFKIVYVGQAGAGKGDRLFVRLRAHKRDHLSQRWMRFSWFGLCPVENGIVQDDYVVDIPGTKDALDHLEAVLVAAAEPPLNLQRGRFGPSVQQYLQAPADAEVNKPVEESDEDEDGDVALEAAD
jgi:hypothetical protein